jgi:SAM-dependent methyltransferase
MDKINSLIIDSTNSKTDLCLLGTKYPTDKSPYNTENTRTTNGSGHRHPYTAVYDFIFSSIRYKEISLAEIGVLDNMSMKCWRDYFTKTKLYGFDYSQEYIDHGKSLNLVNTIYDFIDVKSIESIDSALGKYGKYDVIIEDSTHELNDQIRVCNLAHKHLNPGGILIIEDIFRNIDEDKFLEGISEVKKYYSSITFVMTEHKLKYSPGWDNDKLLILYRNDR